MQLYILIIANQMGLSTFLEQVVHVIVHHGTEAPEIDGHGLELGHFAHGLWQRLDGVPPQQQLLQLLTERYLRGQRADVCLLSIQMPQLLQVPYLWIIEIKL